MEIIEASRNNFCDECDNRKGPFVMAGECNGMLTLLCESCLRKALELIEKNNDKESTIHGS